MNPADVAAIPVSEITIFGMFMNASVLVKVIMLGLLLSSMWCWAIIINKAILFAKTRKAMDKFEQVFWSGQSLEELYTNLSQGQTIGMASLFVGAMREWKRSFQNVGASFMGLHARLEKVLDVSIAREVEKLESNLIVLATVASTAPFVGLFGTVWGIMTMRPTPTCWSPTSTWGSARTGWNSRPSSASALRTSPSCSSATCPGRRPSRERGRQCPGRPS